MLSVAEAAHLLGMENGVIGTLIRQGHLVLAEGPAGTHRRYVTRASVNAYLEAYPLNTTPADGDEPEGELLTFNEVRQLLKLTRPQLSSLVTTRQVVTARKPGSRHVYVTAASASAWATRSGHVVAAVDGRTKGLAAAHL